MSKEIHPVALKIATEKLRRLRLTDVGGDKDIPQETVKSVLKKGLGGLYEDAAVEYILKFGIKYYLEAESNSNKVIERKDHE